MKIMAIISDPNKSKNNLINENKRLMAEGQWLAKEN